MPTLAIPGGHLHYEVRGEGYPVLLYAPGFLSSRIERWSTNPAKPGVPQDWLDPMAALANDFKLIANVGNARQSRATVTEHDDWRSYTADTLALLDHLQVEQCHMMGAYIGVSFALALAQARPALVSALVLQNPIGLSPENRAALDHEFELWTKEVRDWPTSILRRCRRSASACSAATSSSAYHVNSCVVARSRCCSCRAPISCIPP